MAKKKVKKVQAGVFDMTRAGQARPKDKAYKNYYTLVMQGKKALKGSVELMETEEFLKAKGVGISMDKDVAGKMAEGFKPAVCVLDKVAGIKIGVDVAKVCKTKKISNIPVLVCG